MIVRGALPPGDSINNHGKTWLYWTWNHGRSDGTQTALRGSRRRVVVENAGQGGSGRGNGQGHRLRNAKGSRGGVRMRVLLRRRFRNVAGSRDRQGRTHRRG